MFPLSLQRKVFYGLFIFVLVLAGGARADDVGRIYTVTNVLAEASAPSLTEARDQAWQEAQKNALFTLLTRLTAPGDHGKLPPVTVQQAARLAVGVSVAQEKAGGNVYKALLTVRFQPDGVRQLLNRLGVSWNDAVRPRSLVVPIFVGASGPLLWEESNPWKQAWDQLRDAPPQTPVTVPVGDVTDIGTVNTGQAQASELPPLLALAGKYDARLVDVVTARPQAGSTPPAVVVERVTVNGDGPQVQEPFTVAGTAGETLQQVLARAIPQVLAGMGSSWQGGVIGADGAPAPAQPETSTAVRLPVNGLQDWMSRRRQIESLPGVRAVDVVSLSPGRVDVSIRHAGDLVAAFGQMGLALQDQGQGILVARPLGEVMPEDPSLVVQGGSAALPSRTPVIERGNLGDVLPPPQPEPAPAAPVPPVPFQ